MDFAASSAMAASCSAIGSQCSSNSHQMSQNQLHQASLQFQKKQGPVSGSKCSALPIAGEGDLLMDAAVAAAASAAASVLPVYWLYVHSFSHQFSEKSSNSGTENHSVDNLHAPQINSSIGLSGIQLSERNRGASSASRPTSVDASENSPHHSHLIQRQESEIALATHRRELPDLQLKQEVAAKIKDLTKKLRSTKQEELVSYHKLVKAGRIKEGLEVLEHLETQGILDMSKVYHSNFYQECKKQRAVDEAFRYTRLIQSPTLSTFNMLLSVCCNAANTDGAFGALAAMKTAGLKPDCKIYTTLISTCAKASKLDLMFQVFNEMRTLGVEPNLHTFGAMIDGYARVGEVGKAFEVYTAMISKKLKPDSVIFNTLINACGRSGEVKRAFEVFRVLKSDEAQIQPNHITMCSLIDACSRAGDEESAHEVYKMMRRSQVKGTAEAYTAALHACSHKGDLERAFSIYEDLKSDGVKPDEIFFSALIDVAGHAGEVDAAFSILQEIKKYSLAPGPVIFSSLMGVCSNTGKWEEAMVLFKEIHSLGVKPTVSTLNALVTALCRGKQFSKAIQSLQECKETGVSPNQVTYSILLEACEKENEAEVALNLYLNAISEGVVPNLDICDSMIGICFKGITTFTYPPKLASIFPSWIIGEKKKLHYQWLAWAFAVYRQTLSTGVTPTLLILSRMLGCLRIPETSDRNELGLAFQTDSSNSNQHLVEGFGVYDPRASTLYGEAAALGVVPAFQCDSEQIIFEADSLPLYSAEVCLITILKALRHRCAIDATLPVVTINFQSYRRAVTLRDGRVKAITIASRNGQAIAALLRKLRLGFNGNESSGGIELLPQVISQWLRPSGASFRRVVDSSVPASAMLGKSIAEQQRAIRMGTPLPSEPRPPYSMNHRFRRIRSYEP